MFNALQPLLKERGVHILLSAGQDDKLNVYVEPIEKASQTGHEDVAFLTPFRCSATAAELDADLAATLTQWVHSRAAITTPLAESLAAAEAATKAAAEEAKKKAAERTAKKTATTAASIGKTVPAKKAAVVATAATPTLLNEDDGDGEGKGDEQGEESGQQAAPAPVVAVQEASAPVVSIAPEAATVPVPEPANPATVAAAVGSPSIDSLFDD